MNIFSNPKIRWSVISFFAAVQILGFVVFPKSAIENHLVFLSFMYLGLGFLSLDWRQGIKNIICLTCPVFMPVFIFGFGIRWLTLKFFIKG